MKTILVVCGAGASSTFVANRIRSAAASKAVSISVEAASVNDLADRLPEVDALLVGAHLAGNFDALAAQAGALGVPAALLPPTVLAAGGPDAALDLTLALLQSESSPAQTIN